MLSISSFVTDCIALGQRYDQKTKGFYETAGCVNVFVFAFSLFGVFVFVLALAFAVAATRLLRRIHLGLLYALEEDRDGPGAGWCPTKMNWGCYLKDGLRRPSP